MRHLIALSCLLISSIAFAGPSFVLSSTDVSESAPIDNRFVFGGFGCSGDNRSPALSWSGLPENTRSLALTVYDPDAPTGSGWWHWVVIDLPAATDGLPRGAGTPDGSALPDGTRQIRTDFGQPGYGGPCPPAGDKPHRYIFTLHALSVDTLPVPEDATAAMAGFMINANTLATATLTARYGR